MNRNQIHRFGHIKSTFSQFISWKHHPQFALTSLQNTFEEKSEAESVNRGRTDNTMVKVKRTKGQTIIYTTPKSKNRTSLKTGGEFMWSGMVSSPCPTSDTRLVTLVINPLIAQVDSYNWIYSLMTDNYGLDCLIIVLLIINFGVFW